MAWVAGLLLVASSSLTQASGEPDATKPSGATASELAALTGMQMPVPNNKCCNPAAGGNCVVVINGVSVCSPPVSTPTGPSCGHFECYTILRGPFKNDACAANTGTYCNLINSAAGSCVRAIVGTCTLAEGPSGDYCKCVGTTRDFGNRQFCDSNSQLCH